MKESFTRQKLTKFDGRELKALSKRSFRSVIRDPITLLRCYPSLLAMPLWRIFSHPDTFSTVQKQALVESITPFYTRSGLPAFYVNVVFIPIEASSFYIGNKPVRNMVRIAIEHIAIHRPKLDGVENNSRTRMCVDIDKVIIFVYANFLAY